MVSLNGISNAVVLVTGYFAMPLSRSMFRTSIDMDSPARHPESASQT